MAMIKSWKRALPFLLIAVAPLVGAHFAFALPGPVAAPLPLPVTPKPLAAPELDPRLAIEGLAVAAGCVALWWERFRGRR